MAIAKDKSAFIEFMVRSGVLTFGDFTTKSGRRTPYFINAGNYCRGTQAARLGEFYAAAALEYFGRGFDLLFGPAYKGIPLVVATAIALAQRHGRDVPYCFNRKEAKDHGEGGVLIGHFPTEGQKVLIVDDVITAGSSIREAAAILRSAASEITIVGVLVSVDRQELGTAGRSALEEIAAELRIQTRAIVTIDEVVSTLHNRPIDGRVFVDDAVKARIDAYRRSYGAPL